MKTLIFKTVLIIFGSLACVNLGFAQEKFEKLNESFQVNEDVTINVDAKYTHFIFKTWNKGQVKVEAFIEGENLSEEKQQRMLSNWDLNVMGNSKIVRISSQTQGMMGFPHGNMASFMPHNFDDSIFNATDFQAMIAPMMENIARMEPVFPPSFYKNLGGLQFDHVAYSKNGEAYLKSYEKQIQEKFGKDYVQKMQKWGAQIQDEMEARRKTMEQRRADMEVLRGDMAEKRTQLQAHHKEMSERMKEIAQNNQNVNYSKTVTTLPQGGKRIEVRFTNSDTWISENQEKRTVVVYIPKNANLHLQIRHGKLDLENAVSNLNAQLTHTSFTAEEINGKETKIRVSYAPVKIVHWKYGVLNLSYVQDSKIETVNSIKLLSNSSDVEIGNLEKTGILSGSFGELSVLNMGKNFQTLRIHLENSDLKIQLPESAFDFSYNGSNSHINLPTSLKVETQNNYGNKFMNGYYLSQNNSGKISIDANFSEVVLKE